MRFGTFIMVTLSGFTFFFQTAITLFRIWERILPKHLFKPSYLLAFGSALPCIPPAGMRLWAAPWPPGLTSLTLNWQTGKNFSNNTPITNP